jgi:hypothetical protein
MDEKLRTKVTFIKDKYHIRLLEDDLLVNEMACREKIDIGWCCSYMLRWYDKLGGNSVMAIRSRDRWSNKTSNPMGKIWYEKDLRPKGCIQTGSTR